MTHSRRVVAILVIVGAAATTAHAAPSRDRVPIDASDAELIPRPGTVAPVPGETEHAVSSRLIFLNNCKPDGCQIWVGSENSRTNHSRVARQNSLVPAFRYSDDVWNRTVQCVKETYGRFNITVTDVDPCPDPLAGCTTPHWETIVAGRPADISYPNNAAGVSPFDFNSCSIINNSITYAFADVIGPDVDQLCWTIAQETAHSFGLDHEFLGADPMTYLSSPSRKRFQDVNAPCGEWEERTCYCQRPYQNSVQELLDIFGGAPPSPPDIDITNPLPGAAVEPGFIVNATISDDQGVDHVDLVIDGQVTISLTTPPYAFNAPADLGPGGHRVEVRATDLNGTPGSDSVDVIIGEPCSRPGDCSTLGDTYTCVGGRCVPGEGAPGGMGTTCTTPSECVSGTCASNGEEAYCVEPCSPGAGECPSGYGCVATGDDSSGVCWPGAGGGCLGCQTNGRGGPLVPVLGGLLVAGLILRRRRRS